jgi:hypothetical protein
MKVYFNGYQDTWVSPYTILEKVLFWKDWENIDYDTPWVEKWSNRLQPFCKALQKVLQVFRPHIRYVKIDAYDTWSMDHTLAYIIVPMLKQLHATKHGAPLVDDEDVPDDLKSINAPPKENEYDTDGNHFKRWDWVMEEMIWSFEQELKDDDESQFFDHSAYDSDDTKAWFKDMSNGVSKIKIDREGLEAHQKRKQNGFNLFGKYYQALWD